MQSSWVFIRGRLTNHLYVLYHLIHAGHASIGRYLSISSRLQSSVMYSSSVFSRGDPRSDGQPARYLSAVIVRPAEARLPQSHRKHAAPSTGRAAIAGLLIHPTLSVANLNRDYIVKSDGTLWRTGSRVDGPRRVCLSTNGMGPSRFVRPLSERYQRCPA